MRTVVISVGPVPAGPSGKGVSDIGPLAAFYEERHPRCVRGGPVAVVTMACAHPTVPKPKIADFRFAATKPNGMGMGLSGDPPIDHQGPWRGIAACIHVVELCNI